MDAPSRVEELLARAIDEQVAEHRSWQSALDELGARVARLEASVDGMRAELRVIAEEGARAGVAGELDAVSTELRRQINDLGRMIVRDLGRLPKLLREGGPGVAAPASAASAAPPEAHPVTPPAPPSAHDEPAPEVGDPGGDDRRSLFRRR